MKERPLRKRLSVRRGFSIGPICGQCDVCPLRQGDSVKNHIRQLHFFSFGPSVLLLAAISPALANHCPREYGSRCCYPTPVPPHPSSSLGWYYICDFPDGCHARCYGDIAPDMVTRLRNGNPVLISKRPGNIVAGSCSDYMAAITNFGITHASNRQTPGWAGSTDDTLNVRIDTIPVPSAPGDVGPYCVATSSMTLTLNVNVDTYRWIPPDPPNYVQNGCSMHYQDYQTRIREHEAGHVADDEALYAQYQANEQMPKLRVCGASKQDVDNAMRIEKTNAANAILKRWTADQQRAIDKYHQEHGDRVAPMDCGGCP